MKINKHSVRFLAAFVACGVLFMLIVQPIIKNSAQTTADQYVTSINNANNSSNFVQENSMDFQIRAASEIIYPLYMQYMQNNSNIEDYDVLLDNTSDISKKEKELIHDAISSMILNFDANYGSINYYVTDSNQEKVYTNNSSLEYNITNKTAVSSSTTWQLVCHYNNVGMLIVDACSSLNQYYISDSNMANYVDEAKRNLLNVLDNSEKYDDRINNIENVSFAIEITKSMGIGNTVSYSYDSSSSSYILSYSMKSNHGAALASVQIAMILCAIYYILKVPKFFKTKAYSYMMQIPVEVVLFVWLITVLCGFDLNYNTIFGTYHSLPISTFYYMVYMACYAFSFTGTLWLIFFMYKSKKEGWRKTYHSSSIFFQGKEVVRMTCNFFISTLCCISEEPKKRVMWLVILLHTLFLCILYYMNILFLVIYAIGLYFLWRHVLRISRSDYEALKQTIEHFSNGEYDYEIQDLGVYDPLKSNLVTIQEGVRKAIAQEIASQRMKNELITNVSHDLKTPLTSIISYIDLMKDPDISNEDQQKYLNTVDKSADRLKHLIEDLFEISKASSGAISVELMEADLISLLKQVEMECHHTFERRQLSIKHHFSDEKILLSIDPQKTYRIFENLYSNVGKYALEKTRVFIQVTDFDSRVDIEIKNISKSELNFTAEEIMERFTRGDKSRNTEGSGLGLAIAKSFTELMQGSMRLELDGDVFKVTISFYK